MTPALALLIYEVEKEEEKLAIIRPTAYLHYLAELVFLVVVQLSSKSVLLLILISKDT